MQVSLFVRTGIALWRRLFLVTCGSLFPAAKDFRPYRDYIGSHIEVMDVHNGHRKILHTAPNSLQAPNWTPDNKYLIYNAEGLLYKYELSTGSYRYAEYRLCKE